MSDMQGRLYDDVLAVAGEQARDSHDVLADSDAALQDKVAVADALGGAGRGIPRRGDAPPRPRSCSPRTDPTPHRGPESRRVGGLGRRRTHAAQRAAVESGVRR
jgi:hypothetical protein